MWNLLYSRLPTATMLGQVSKHLQKYKTNCNEIQAVLTLGHFTSFFVKHSWESDKV